MKLTKALRNMRDDMATIVYELTTPQRRGLFAPTTDALLNKPTTIRALLLDIHRRLGSVAETTGAQTNTTKAMMENMPSRIVGAMFGPDYSQPRIAHPAGYLLERVLEMGPQLERMYDRQGHHGQSLADVREKIARMDTEHRAHDEVGNGALDALADRLIRIESRIDEVHAFMLASESKGPIVTALNHVGTDVLAVKRELDEHRKLHDNIK